jgi:PmbA protein
MAFALDRARRQGLTAEACFSLSRTLDIRCFAGRVEHFERAESSGIGLRVFESGRSALAYTELLTPEALSTTLDQAAAACRHLAAQDGVGPASPETLPVVAEPETSDVEEHPAERKIALALAAEAAARAAGPEVVNVPWAGYSDVAHEFMLAATNGLDLSRRASRATLAVQALAARGNDRKTYVDFIFARRLAELAPDKVGLAAGAGAIGLLGAAQPAGGATDLLFAPRAFARLLGLFAPQFSALSTEEHSSPLAGRLGDTIGAADLNLVDDAVIPDGPASRGFDGEGTASRRTPLIDSGRLSGLLHSVETARRAGIASTGHAARSYSDQPGIAPSNLFIPAGRASPDSLRAGARIEVVAILGTAGANPVSGEFSLPAVGYALSNGRRSSPLHNFTVAGSFEGLLQAVRGVGRDFEFGLPGLTTAIGCGSVLAGGLAVAGRG